ncbi:MAG: DegT/DnrJ/EryC1/StrS family aminotransferase, partial [Candidatus Pacearchaeota archaeon]|nr:DegT/DnrJ/EryC1/StrS family aminotransferase [Candidatus Pacearchaeota archaeon]
LLVPRKLPAPESFIKEIDVLEYTQRENIKYDNEKIIVQNNEVGGGGGKYIDRKVKIDKRLCKLLGYFAAEGGYESETNGGGLRFTFGLHEKNTYVKEVADIFESIWPSFKASIMSGKGNKCSVSAGGLLHSDLFRNLNCGENVYEKAIPSIIWSTTDGNKFAFIEGLLNGDGHERVINGSESRKLKVASEDLANGLHYLLLTLGVQSRLEKHAYYSKNGKLCHSYTCEILGFGKQRTAKENCVPVEFLSLDKGSLRLQKGRLRDKESVSVETLKKWVREKQIRCPDLLLQDVALLKINEIKKEKFHEFVYDFEVKGAQNFIGGYGAVCLHNTGEGGAVLTDNARVADACRSMANQGRKVKSGKWLEHVQLGYNYRLPEVSCALGIEQMKRLGPILKKREAVARFYAERLKGVEGIVAPGEAERTRRSWFVYVVLLAKPYTARKRDALISRLAKRGVQSRPYFVPIHLQPFYKKTFGYRPGMFKNTESVGGRTLALPFFTSMKKSEVEYVVSCLRELV